MTFTMAIDQHGQHYDNLGKHPRKELLSRLYRRNAEKMYINNTDGVAMHVGYVIAGLWLNLYEMEPWRKPG